MSEPSPRPDDAPAPRSGGIAARAMGGRGEGVPRAPEPGAAARRRDDRRAGAGARRRRHRQDARADHPHRPSPRHRPRQALGDPRRHLHQQGGARDEGPRSATSSAAWSRACSGSARSTRSAPRSCAAMPRLVGLKSDFTILDTDDQIRLMKQIIEAENIDEKRWPARQLAGLIDSWKNRGLAPKDVAEADASAFANGSGRKLYAAYQERLKTLNAADFGDLLLETLRLFREHPDVLADYQQPLPLHAGRRVPGHQRRAVSLAAAAGAGDAATSAASATTTSRSMAGAAPRSTTSCASRRIFPARRSSGSSATTARPATSSAPPRTSSPTMRAGSARRCSPTRRPGRGRRSRSPRPGIPRRRRAPSARRSSSSSARATR